MKHDVVKTVLCTYTVVMCSSIKETTFQTHT